MEERTEDKYTVKSLVKALRILELLASEQKLGIGELNERTGYGKSTVHRILGTLKAERYVNQDIMDDKYFATLKLFELGNLVANRIPIKAVAHPHLKALYDSCRETVNLGILVEDEVLYLDKMITKAPLRIVEIGRKAPAHATAMGKVLMAFSRGKDPERLEYRPYTSKSVGDPKAFAKMLEEVRKKGYAFDDGEFIEGLLCMARPILDKSGHAVAAISISMPAARADEETGKKHLALLEETAERIQEELGFGRSDR